MTNISKLFERKPFKKGSAAPLDFIGHGPFFIMALGFATLSILFTLATGVGGIDSLLALALFSALAIVAIVGWPISRRRLLAQGYGDVIRDHHRRLNPELYGDAPAPLPFEPTDMDWEEGV